MAEFTERGLQKNSYEMSAQQRRFRFIRNSLDDLVKQMSVEEIFDGSLQSLVKLERELEYENNEMSRMTEILFLIDRRYQRCEDRIIDDAENIRRRRVLRGIERFNLEMPKGFNIDIKLY